MKNIVLTIIGIVIIAAIAFIFIGKTETTNTTTANKPAQNNSITIKGSDTEVQMVSTLAEAFSEENPEAKISVTGGGSGVGIAALLNKEIDVANSSRKMKDEELKQAESKKLNIQEFIVARDGLTIIVNPANSISQLTMEQLGKIFKGDTSDWGELGAGNGEITLYGRQTTSGTYTFFRDTVIKDDYAASMRNMEGNEAIVDAVKSDKNGIGYVGIGYVKDENNQPKKDIKIIPVAKDSMAKAVSPIDVAAVKRGEYPIFRPIYQFLPNNPQKDSLLEKFFQFETSKQGEAIIEKAGFYTITAEDKILNQKFFQNIK